MEAEVDSSGKSHRQPPPDNLGRVPLMQNERVVFSHEIRPNQGFRIVVTGDVDLAMVEAMEAFATFQKTLATKASPKDKADGESQ